tara:strand:- start:94 stop:408 length:315 start_codon:yes stop_codon:yes gene_type:complete
MNLIYKFLIINLILIFFSGCQSVKNTLSMKKEQTVDEFLIEKKNPLVLPPEFSKLPLPKNDDETIKEQKDDIDFSKVLEDSKDKNKIKETSELEKSISDLLNKK